MSPEPGESGEEEYLEGDEETDESSAGLSAATDHANLAEAGAGNGEPGSGSEAEENDPTTEYEYAHNLAQTGRSGSLLLKREQLLQNGICTEDEFDTLLVEALTNRIGDLVRSAETIKGQIAYIRKEMGWSGVDDSGKAASIDPIHQRIIELNSQRVEILAGISQRQTNELKTALEKIAQTDPDQPSTITDTD